MSQPYLRHNIFVQDKAKMKTVIVTGGCGFIGHHLVEHLIKTTNWKVIILDKLSYASFGYDRISDIEFTKSQRKRISIYPIDLSYPLSFGMKKQLGDVHIIFHLAADTHVDMSINDPVETVRNNVMSTVHLLEYTRSLHKTLEKFIYFSTDEVYGSANPSVKFNEDDRHNPGNPYSASKSAAEQVCVSYFNTYNVPILRVNVMNVFGERQHPEKFIPKIVKKFLNGENVDIYDEKGSRCYIHARNVSSAVLFILRNGKVGECYNINGEKEVKNIDMVYFIAKIMGTTCQYEITKDKRPGNDRRYSLNGEKLEKMGWSPPKDFYYSLEKTVQWTLNNQKWLNT